MQAVNFSSLPVFRLINQFGGKNCEHELDQLALGGRDIGQVWFDLVWGQELVWFGGKNCEHELDQMALRG